MRGVQGYGGMHTTNYIGTSGFQYSFWKEKFYPKGLSGAKQLDFYAGKFNTVEINGTFYKFPTVKTITNLAAKAPDGFKITIKAHKIITHTLRMANARDKVAEFLDVVLPALGSKAGCILYQLPPSYSYTQQRLSDILTSVPNIAQTVVEFRHASWWVPEVFKALKDAGITFCSVSYPGLPDDNIVTSGVFYKRMHGIPELFKSSYSEPELKALASNLSHQGDIYVYFNNTYFEAGYQNAALLKQLLDDVK